MLVVCTRQFSTVWQEANSIESNDSAVTDYQLKSNFGKKYETLNSYLNENYKTGDTESRYSHRYVIGNLYFLGHCGTVLHHETHM